MSRWSELPPELLQAIAQKQTNFVYYISTRAVCKSWHTALPKRPPEIICQLPWLLLPYNKNKPNHRGFYNLADGKTYQLNFPEAYEKRSCGSSHGWLVMLEDTPSIFLLNPLTKARIELPSLSTFPNFPTEVIYENCRNLHETRIRDSKLRIRDRFIKKAIVSADPSLTTSFMVAAIYGEDENLALCKSSDTAWSVMAETPQPAQYKDIMFHSGKLYGVDDKGNVSMCTMDTSIPITKAHFANSPPIPPILGYKQWYLSNLNEDIILFGRFRKYNMPGRYEYQTFKFVAYKINPKETMWTEMENLGDRMFFLGWNCSHSVQAPDTPNCRGNCIYFTDNKFRICTDFLWEGHDFGVFYSNGGSVQRLGLPTYPTKSPRLPYVFHYEESLKRDFSVLCLPPPLWIILSP